MNAQARKLDTQDPERATRIYYYWLLVALFFEYARPASYIPFLAIPFLYSIVPVALLVASMFAKGLRPMKDIFGDPMAKWILIFFGLVSFSIVHADVSLYVFNIWKWELGYVMLFIMVARIATTRARLRGVFATLLVSHLFLLAMNPVVVTDPDNRHYILGATFLGDGNDFSLSLCILLPFTIEIALTRKKLWSRVLAWVGMGLLVMAIIGTQSRGASLGMAAVLFFLWLLSTKKMVSLIGVAVVGLIVMIYAPPVYFQRMGTVANYQEDGSAQGRIEAWKGAINMALTYPLTGVGSGQFPTAFGTKFRTPGAAHMPWLTAHSSYFLMLGELGFPGVLVYLTMVIGNFRANMRVRREVLARAGPTPSEDAREDARMLYLTSAAMIGFAVPAAFLSAAYYPHIFILTAVLISARHIAAQNAGIEWGARDVAAMRRKRVKSPKTAGATTETAGQAPSQPQPRFPRARTLRSR